MNSNSLFYSREGSVHVWYSKRFDRNGYFWRNL